MKASNLISFFNRSVLIVVVFIVSIIVGNLYINGDQIAYTRVYERIGSYELLEAFVYYANSLSSVEIFHFITIYIFSDLLPKNILFSFINALFAFLVIRYFDKLKVNFFVTSIFILTNFYIYVLFFAAERLKFGFILLLFGLCLQKDGKLKSSIVLASVLGHLQMAVVIAPMIFEIVFLKIKEVFSQKKIRFNLLNLFSSAIFALLIFYILSIFLDSFLLKLAAYKQESSLSEFLRIFLFFILALWYAKKDNNTLKAILYFIPIIVAIYFIGGDRVNMIAYIYFMYFALRYKNGINIGVLITSIYFFGKMVMFLSSINQLGHGFG